MQKIQKKFDRTVFFVILAESPSGLECANMSVKVIMVLFLGMCLIGMVAAMIGTGQSDQVCPRKVFKKTKR